jgi:transcriptional regulator with XRE-family HTH domain
LYSKFVELLNKSGKTTAQVCRDTGISESVISNLKTRGGNLSAGNLKKLAEYFGVSIDYFFEEA